MTEADKKQREKPTFVDYVIRGDRPYGIIRRRQELMDKLFIEEPVLEPSPNPDKKIISEKH